MDLALSDTTERLDPADLASLVTAQDGLLTWAQLRAAGFAEATIQRRARGWQRIHPGVWFTTPSHDGTIPFRTLARAAVLHAGPSSRIALGAAAYLHGLDDAPPPVITIFVPYGCKVASRPGLVVRREREGVRLASCGDLPMTGIDDTVLDLTNEGGPGAAVGWVTRAVQRGRTTPARLRDRLEHRHRLKHRVLLEELLVEVEDGATTPLEVRARRTVFRPHGLPMGEWQARRGSRGYVIDDAIDEYDVLIELDGRRGHVEEGAFRDRVRDNDHARAGWTTLRFGWREIADDPCGVAAQIAQVLRERGWPGPDVVHRACSAREDVRPETEPRGPRGPRGA